MDSDLIIAPSVASDESLEDLPATLAAEELQLALNKEATEEQLVKAITRCKHLVLETVNYSLERRWLVRHLIELRLRLQECKEAKEDPQHPRNKSSGVSKRTIKGHHLNLQSLINSSSKYCDHCTGAIWCLVQAWYQCEDCFYSCHHKCLSSIMRECAHMVISEKGQYELEICPELGLSAQQYKCAECGSNLTIKKDWSEARKCDYNGLYYCASCHWGGEAVVPARVIHNWDLNPRPVCQASLQQLRVTAERPFIKLKELNPKLFIFVLELNLVERLRNTLHSMRKYLLVCRLAEEEHLLWKNVDFPHLMETPEMYSLQDLVDTHSGELVTKLQSWIDTFSDHVKTTCEICRGRGHICEICDNEEVLYPFDSTAYLCKVCGGVFHKHCFARKEKCPKCERRKLRTESIGENSDDSD